MRQSRYGVAALVLALLWSHQAAAAAKVELLQVGNDTSVNRWCDKDNRMLLPGATMNVTIVGHVVPGAVSVVTGTIRVISQNFQWAYPPPYPSVTFTPTTVSAPEHIPALRRPFHPPGAVLGRVRGGR